MSERELSFKYIFSDDYNPKYVNGALGGVDIQGEITINFYMERRPIPNKDFVKITDDQTTFNSDPEDLDNSFIRVIQSGVIMSKERAEDIYNFLGSLLGKGENNEENEHNE